MEQVKTGDIKIRRKYAILPTNTNKGWVWLRYYVAKQEYKVMYIREEYVRSTGLLEDALTTTGLLNESTYTHYKKHYYWETIEKRI